jgi:hypothetical protein
MPWTQIGMVIGGMISGILVGAIWWSKHLSLKSGNREIRDTAEHGPPVRRDEFSLGMSELRIRLDEAALEAREARAAANAAQASLATIGQMIESAMRALGDRLEGALRDVKDRVDGHDEEITDHHGRLRSVETELKLTRGSHD